MGRERETFLRKVSSSLSQIPSLLLPHTFSGGARRKFKREMGSAWKKVDGFFLEDQERQVIRFPLRSRVEFARIFLR